jgi:SAM-dependent methyltransferase
MNELVWHEVECGGYSADLPLWEELAAQTDKPIMELGCGAGRVTLHLAEKTGLLVIGLDHNRKLVEAIWERGHGTTADAEQADIRGFEPMATKFSLVIAPMQVMQLLSDSQERVASLSCVVDSMRPGARAAFAIVEQMPDLPPPGTSAPPPLPDVCEIEGWIYSSLPLEPVALPSAILLRRLRQTVDPDGNMSEELNEIELAMLSAETLEEEGRSVGLQPSGRRQIPSTEAHVGSTVVLFEKVS